MRMICWHCSTFKKRLSKEETQKIVVRVRAVRSVCVAYGPLENGRSNLLHFEVHRAIWNFKCAVRTCCQRRLVDGNTWKLRAPRCVALEGLQQFPKAGRVLRVEIHAFDLLLVHER